MSRPVGGDLPVSVTAEKEQALESGHGARRAEIGSALFFDVLSALGTVPGTQ